QPNTPVARQPVPKEGERVPIPLGERGLAQHDAEESNAPAARRAHQDVAGSSRVAGLHADDPVEARNEIVSVLDQPWTKPAPQASLRHPYDAREGPVVEQHAAQSNKIESGREVPGLVEADRVRVMGVGEPERDRLSVHLADE